MNCSGRPFFKYCATFPEEVIGKDFASSLVEEFWPSLAVNAMLTVHIDLLRSRKFWPYRRSHLQGRRARHARRNPDFQEIRISIPSTKGVLA